MSSVQFSSDKIENFKTLVVYGSFLNSTTFTFDFNNLIEFVPDELCLNSISFVDNSVTPAHTAPICLISSDLVNNYILCSLPNLQGIGNLSKLDTYFKINQAVQGTKTFTIKAFNGNIPTTDPIADFYLSVALTITFYKYKSMK